MALENFGTNVPALTASADLSTHQYKFVKMSGAQTVALAGDGELMVGVLQNKPVSGESASVWGTGSLSKVEAGAVVTAGDPVASDAAGLAVAATAGEERAGIALDAASGAGELISVYLTMPGKA